MSFLVLPPEELVDSVCFETGFERAFGFELNFGGFVDFEVFVVCSALVESDLDLCL